MRLRKILQNISIYVTNEEQDLLDKFPDHQVNLASIVERDKIVIENLIFDNDVVITYNFYKRKQRIGDIIAQQGDCILRQIAAKHHNGSASQALQKFFELWKRKRV